MPSRALVAKEFASFLGALANPQRVRILEELRSGERDVNSLQQILGVSASNVSQNLAVLRSHRLVQERREGRHVFYSLPNGEVAEWLLSGLRFLETEFVYSEELRGALVSARNQWSVEDSTA